MIKSTILGAVVLLTTTLQQCNDDDFIVHKGTITEFHAPETCRLNDNFNITVTFSGGTNGCATAHELNENMEGDTLFIEAFYKVPREDRTCNMAIPVHVIEFETKATNKDKIVISSLDRRISRVVNVTETPNQ